MNENLADRIDQCLARTRGGCDCTLRESCPRCTSVGPVAEMEAVLRSIARELRGEPEPPTPTLEDYGRVYALALEIFHNPPVYFTTTERTPRNSLI